MKTQTMIATRKHSMITMAFTLLFLTACGNNQKESEIQGEQTQAAQEIVKSPKMDIHTATFLGDLDVIKQHIQAGTDLNEKEPVMGSTPLISAAVFGKTEIARALIEGGADVNLKNNEGSTPLHSAVFLCRPEIVELLLKNGADKNQLNNYGSTALQSVLAPFADVKFIYDQFSKDLGPLGFKLDYEYVEDTRPKIADLLR